MTWACRFCKAPWLILIGAWGRLLQQQSLRHYIFICTPWCPCVLAESLHTLTSGVAMWLALSSETLTKQRLKKHQHLHTRPCPFSTAFGTEWKHSGDPAGDPRLGQPPAPTTRNVTQAFLDSLAQGEPEKWLQPGQGPQERSEEQVPSWMHTKVLTHRIMSK